MGKRIENMLIWFGHDIMWADTNAVIDGKAEKDELY